MMNLEPVMNGTCLLHTFHGDQTQAILVELNLRDGRREEAGEPHVNEVKY
jgi:hypothetical protein